MNKSINWASRYNAAEKRLSAKPTKIAPQIIYKPAGYWAGLAKVNGRRQAMANAKAHFDLAHFYLTKGMVHVAKHMIAKGMIELEAAKVLARIC